MASENDDANNHATSNGVQVIVEVSRLQTILFTKEHIVIIQWNSGSRQEEYKLH